MPSIHGRITRNMFALLIERIDARLEGWKTKFLSFAGRQVLAKSIISSIPYYAMQSTLLPEGICDLIDRKIRSFVWSSVDGHRRMHLVRWEEVTRSKQGGLGIRRTKDMNIAFLAKLGWRMETKGESLWAQVLKDKYGNRDMRLEDARWKPGASNTWRGIINSLPVVREGTRKWVKRGDDTILG